MNKQTTNAMLSLIRCAVCGSEVSEDIKKSLTAECLPQLYALSKAHDVAHLVAQTLGDLGLLGSDESSTKFQKQQMMAVYRYRQIEYELQRICEKLEEAAIPFIPLKGSVIRQYYPEPWMRTSCDVDVFVHEEDLDRAIEVLVSKLEYRNEGRWYNDVSLYSPSNVHLELHFSLIEDDRFPKANRILDTVWETSRAKDGCRFHLLMSQEMYYFYHVLHMAKHFVEGGCGVRPFLDLWILNHRVECDPSARQALLAESALGQFDAQCRRLAEAWFSRAEMDERLMQMERYLLRGGVYGSNENKIAATQGEQGTERSYLLQRIFVPYRRLKLRYPILEKHRWMTPFCQVYRWFAALFGGRLKSSVKEAKANRNVTKEQVDEINEMMQNLGIEEAK